MSQSTQKRHSYDICDCGIYEIFILSLISPILSYGYTRRFRALTVFLSVGFGVLLLACSMIEYREINKKKAHGLLAFGVAGIAALDNTRFVLNARKKTETK